MKKKGFTLIELLVVMAIIGILAGVIGSTFVSSQRRGRDAQRKSDLKNIAHALELFYNDYNKYPSSEGGIIKACPYQVKADGSVVATNCDWEGESTFQGTASDGSVKTVYMEKVPADPGPQFYYYRSSSGASPQKYQLYARLDNTEDKNLISGLDVSCGTGFTCNYSVTSSNSLPTESIE
jgi:prepilin-type N-terminal cleavage/methylation domain-containing protein